MTQSFTENIRRSTEKKLIVLFVKLCVFSVCSVSKLPGS